MAAAAIDLLAETAKVRAFGAHGRRWALARFEQGAIVGRYREVYQRALAGAR